jgi:hypothetical protein
MSELDLYYQISIIIKYRPLRMLDVKAESRFAVSSATAGYSTRLWAFVEIEVRLIIF